MSAALVVVGPAAGRVGGGSEFGNVPPSPVYFLGIRSVDERLHSFYRWRSAAVGKREMEIQDDRPKRQEFGEEEELDVDWL